MMLLLKYTSIIYMVLGAPKVNNHNTILSRPYLQDLSSLKISYILNTITPCLQILAREILHKYYIFIKLLYTTKYLYIN